MSLKFSKYIASGSGLGGGKGGGSPDIADVSGYSTDYATVLMALGEGQIEGIKGGAKGFLLDDTPIENTDGTRNFEDLTYYFTPGTLDQPGIPSSASEVVSENNVGVEVKKSLPVTRSFVNNEVNRVRVRIGVRIQRQEDDGDVKPGDLAFNIYIKEGTGGAFILRHSQTITARFTDTTVFQYSFAVNNAGGTIDEFSVRVEKISDDSTDKYMRDLQFLSYQEVIESRLEYPNTALVWVQFPSKMFKSIPSIKLDVGGVLFPIPTNATVNPADGGLTFSGGWNGSFYTPALATSDPAWILYGILTNRRYGLGREIGINGVDKWALYQCSLYNNGVVADGFGGSERRFMFDGIIQGDQDAWEVITSICSNFAAKPYWDGSMISFWQDRPWVDGMRQFTNADVEEGRFVYTSSEWKSIATVARVTYNPPPDYEPTVELVEDPIGLNQYGVHFTDFTAFGETRRGGAVRAGRRVLLSTRLDNEQISFKARAFSSLLRPGEVIQVSDTRRHKIRKAGLLVSGTQFTLNLDAPVFISSLATVSVTMPDMTVAEVPVGNGVGTTQTLILATPLPQVPLTHANWILKDTVQPRKYRVLSVSPDRSNPNLNEISGIRYSG